MFCSFFFFFSSRRRHTRWTGDWSSDVCSSDLDADEEAGNAGPDRVLEAIDEHPERERQRADIGLADPARAVNLDQRGRGVDGLLDDAEGQAGDGSHQEPGPRVELLLPDLE